MSDKEVFNYEHLVSEHFHDTLMKNSLSSREVPAIALAVSLQTGTEQRYLIKIVELEAELDPKAMVAPGKFIVRLCQDYRFRLTIALN